VGMAILLSDLISIEKFTFFQIAIINGSEEVFTVFSLA
jgi:hypothetical protein